MPNAIADSLQFTPLLPNSDFSEFVSNLEAGDVRARFGFPVEEESLWPLLAPSIPDCRAIGAWTGRSLVGVGMLARFAPGEWEFALIVRSDLKRRRIGSALVHHAFANARALGAEAVVAHVRSDNTPARGLVRSVGFVAVGGPGLEQFYVARLSTEQTVG